MILLLLSLARDQLFYYSPRRKLDKIDHLLMGVIHACLLVLFMTLPHVVLSEEQLVDSDFFFACSGGKLEKVQGFLKDHPGWVNARTDNGEACLHLTGIYGHSHVTEYLLVQGADPNIRSTYDQGLRMHPLSWNIYGGHFANVKLLLDYGADVNLDFDSMMDKNQAVTALDVVMALKRNEAGDERFSNLESLLRAHGAKMYEELGVDDNDEDAVPEQEL